MTNHLTYKYLINKKKCSCHHRRSYQEAMRSGHRLLRKQRAEHRSIKGRTPAEDLLSLVQEQKGTQTLFSD